jgi:hypothetical protein
MEAAFKFTTFRPRLSKLQNTKIERKNGNNSDCVYSLLEYLELINADQASILRARKRAGYTEIIIHLLRMKYPDYLFEFKSYSDKNLFLKDLTSAITEYNEMAVVMYYSESGFSHVNLVSKNSPSFYYCYDPQLEDAVHGIAAIKPGSEAANLFSAAVAFKILISYKK